MTQLKRHPLYHSADNLKRAFVLNGFCMMDDEEAPELLTAEQASVPVFAMPEEISCEPVLLEDGSYALRSELLGSVLHTLRGRLPLSAITCGRVYDRKDEEYPARLFLEGVYAAEGATFKDYKTLWEKIAAEAYGIGASLELERTGKDVYRIRVKTDPSCDGTDGFVLGYTGKAGWTARTMLGIENPGIPVWIFAIDVDAAAIHDHSLKDRADLYDPRMTFLKRFDGAGPVFGGTFSGKAADLLRKRGFMEFSGLKIFEADAYRKMNMIQESWDTNNEGVRLSEPLGNKTGLPTVLTPALEEALAANYKAGEKEVRLFEIGHIFHPAGSSKPTGEDPALAEVSGEPTEELFLSLGVYGPGIDKDAFRKEIDSFLTELGIRNHFFIPTTMAIAYNVTECWLVLDENPAYLGGNFGGISPVAEKNHGIGTHAFMAQLELKPLKDKAAAEYAFVPNELK